MALKMCDEMHKLRALLDEKGIEWIDQSDITPDEESEVCLKASNYKFGSDMFDMTIYRTHFSVGKKKYSVVYGFGTYGGYSPVWHKDDALLELWQLNGNDYPHGWLTAEEVIKECLEET